MVRWLEGSQVLPAGRQRPLDHLAIEPSKRFSKEKLKENRT